MRVSRVVPMLLVFLLLSGGQVLFLTSWAYAGCCNCWRPVQPCYMCSCLLRAEAFVEEATGVAPTEFTISTKNSGGLKVEASEDVIKEILDLRKRGKIAYGDYLFKASGSAQNLKLKCVGFVAIDPEEEKKSPDDLKALNLKRSIDDFEKEHPKMTKQ